MMKNNRIVSTIIFAIIIVLILALVVYEGIDAKPPVITYTPDNGYSRTLIAVADKDFEPYSFIDKDGNPSGYDVELIYMLADEMRCNIEVRLMSWNDANAAIENGEADILLGALYSYDNSRSFDTTMPTANDPLLIFGKGSYSSFGDLYNKKIAVLTDSETIPLFLEPYGLAANAAEYETYTDAFDSVINHETDCVLVTYSVGKRLSANYPEIKALGNRLAECTFCIAVPKGSGLISEINSAVIKKRADGSLSKLSDKWLGNYVEIVTFEDFFKQHISSLLIFIMLLLLIPAFGLAYIYKKRNSSLERNECILLEHISKEPMTGLYNRVAAQAMVEEILSHKKEGTRYAFIMMDIDNFKNINDTFGHIFGDKVLMKTTMAIKNIFREQDILSRIGGDEFAVFLSGFKTEEDLIAMAERVNQFLFEPDSEVNIEISVSIGIAICPEHGTTLRELYNNADVAMYNSKGTKKGKVSIFSEQ